MIYWHMHMMLMKIDRIFPNIIMKNAVDSVNVCVWKKIKAAVVWVEMNFLIEFFISWSKDCTETLNVLFHKSTSEQEKVWNHHRNI